MKLKAIYFVTNIKWFSLPKLGVDGINLKKYIYCNENAEIWTLFSMKYINMTKNSGKYDAHANDDTVWSGNCNPFSVNQEATSGKCWSI